MRVNGPQRTGGMNGGAAPRREGGDGFSVGQGAEAPRSAAIRSSAALSGLEAMLALQEVDGMGSERRRRAVRRGNDMLDLLDDVRLGLLSGRLSPEKLTRLSLIAAQDRGDVAADEPRLREVLDEIELRAQVELAKFARSGR